MDINLFKMPSSSRVLLLCAMFSLTNALPQPGPDPTASYKPADWNPRPTNVPQSPSELLKRESLNVNICGWVDGNINDPVTCPSDQRCVYDTSCGMVGCCPTSGSCTTGVYTSCVETAKGALNPSILTCTGGSVCYQNMFPGDYYQYGCAASTDTRTIATTHSGQNWASQLSVLYTQLTLATTQSASNTISGTVTGAQSASSPSAAFNSTSSSPMATETSTSQTTISTSLPVGIQAVASTSAASVAATGSGPQAQAGIIAGSVVGGVGVVFAILALCCGLLRRRQGKKIQERARSMTTIEEKTMSYSSYASSRISDHTRIHPFSPDDIVSPMTLHQELAIPIVPLQQAVSMEPKHDEDMTNGSHNTSTRPVDLVDPHVAQPLLEAEQPYVRRVQLIDGPGIDELADLPPPWVRPPTPPLRSPRRLATKVQAPELDTPLETYLRSAVSPIRPSSSVASYNSDTSRYSRATDGRSMKSIREPVVKHKSWRGEDAPPMPITRKPVGSGWYRTMAPLVERKASDHVAFQMSPEAPRGRSLTPPQQARERSSSAQPVHTSATENIPMSATIYDVQELDIMGLEFDWVAPLRLSSSLSHRPTQAVKKRGNTPVPILGVPAAPPPGGRGNRLYEVQ